MARALKEASQRSDPEAHELSASYGACTQKSNETLRAYVRLAPNSGARADIPGSPRTLPDSCTAAKCVLFDQFVGRKQRCGRSAGLLRNRGGRSTLRHRAG